MHDRNYERGGMGGNPGGYGGGGGGYGGGGGAGGGGGGYGRRRGTPLSELDPALTSVSHTVIGCARDVHVALGPGYSEDVYLEALMQEMAAAGVAFKARHPLPVTFKGKQVGTTVADLFVADRFIVEVMAAPIDIGSYERTQLRSQLRAADVELGLIINFAGRLLKDGLVRVLNPDKLNAMKGEGGEHAHDDDGGTHVDFDEGH